MTKFCGCVARIGADGSKWGLSHLRWTIAIPTFDLVKQRSITEKMFKDISSICGLTFEYTRSVNEANLVYLAGRGIRSDLDGPGGTLAYAYLPPNRNYRGQLNCVFDLDEAFNQWVPGDADPSKRSINFYNVLYHETLHLLGWSHKQGSGFLMSAIYDQSIYRPTSVEMHEMKLEYGPPAIVEAVPAPEPKPETDDVISVMIDGVRKTGRIVWT